MNTQTKAIMVTAQPGERQGLDELNRALNRGWRVTHMTGMGGAGFGVNGSLPELCFTALVIIERDGQNRPLETHMQMLDHDHDSNHEELLLKKIARGLVPDGGG